MAMAVLTFFAALPVGLALIVVAGGAMGNMACVLIDNPLLLTTL